MIRDASSVSPETVIERDVCIVGAGVAGISLALELDRRGISVCLLESGGHVLEAAAQDLYWGEAPRGDLIAEPDYLWHSRLRFLGGTTNHWAGYCSPLDPIDFETRSWVPNSGWPFGRETLEPWYRRAATWLEIPPWN
ncbi:MAG: FAD-dependent oxidoreductase, partial [Myxococcota bacterium]|nr:FAD-dependent oxidoreductase [Myxococcota bacterium]